MTRPLIRLMAYSVLALLLSGCAQRFCLRVYPPKTLGPGEELRRVHLVVGENLLLDPEDLEPQGRGEKVMMLDASRPEDKCVLNLFLELNQHAYVDADYEESVSKSARSSPARSLNPDSRAQTWDIEDADEPDGWASKSRGKRMELHIPMKALKEQKDLRAAVVVWWSKGSLDQFQVLPIKNSEMREYGVIDIRVDYNKSTRSLSQKR